MLQDQISSTPLENRNEIKKKTGVIIDGNGIATFKAWNPTEYLFEANLI